MVDMSTKFDEKTSNGVVSIVFTGSMYGRTDGRTEPRTDGTTAALLYPHRNALREDNKQPMLNFFNSMFKFKVKVKNHGTMRKILPQGIHLCNMKALSLLVVKLWPSFCSRKQADPNADTVADTRAMTLAPLKISKNRATGKYLGYQCMPIIFMTHRSFSVILSSHIGNPSQFASVMTDGPM